MPTRRSWLSANGLERPLTVAPCSAGRAPAPPRQSLCPTIELGTAAPSPGLRPPRARRQRNMQEHRRAAQLQDSVVGGVAQVASGIARGRGLEPGPIQRDPDRERGRAGSLRRALRLEGEGSGDTSFRIGEQAADPVHRAGLDADATAPRGDTEHQNRARPRRQDRGELRFEGAIARVEHEAVRRLPEDAA